MGFGSDWGWWWWCTTGTSALAHPPSFNSQSSGHMGFLSVSHHMSSYETRSLSDLLWDDMTACIVVTPCVEFLVYGSHTFSGSVLFMLLYRPLLAVCCTACDLFAVQILTAKPFSLKLNHSRPVFIFKQIQILQCHSSVFSWKTRGAWSRAEKGVQCPPSETHRGKNSLAFAYAFL